MCVQCILGLLAVQMHFIIVDITKQQCAAFKDVSSRQILEKCLLGMLFMQCAHSAKFCTLATTQTLVRPFATNYQGFQVVK